MSEEKKVFRMARYTYDAWRELRKKDFGENGFDDKEEEYLLDEEDITELPFPIAWDDKEYDEDDVEDYDEGRLPPDRTKRRDLRRSIFRNR